MQDSDDFFLDLDSNPKFKDPSRIEAQTKLPLSQRVSEGLLRFSQRTQRSNAFTKEYSEVVQPRNKFEEFLKSKKVILKQDENYKHTFHYSGEPGTTSFLTVELNKAFRDRELREELIEVLEDVTQQEPMLKLYLSPITTNTGEQDTMFRCLLLCENIQTKIVEIIINNANIFATKTGSSDGQTAAACIHQIRYLEHIYDNNAFLAPIFDKDINKWSPEPRDTLIECLPEVLVDPLTHGHVASQLLDFVLMETTKEPASFQSAVLSTLCLLRLPEKISTQIRISLCKHIMTFEAVNIPDTLSFCIQTLSSTSNTFSQLLQDVDKYLQIEDLRIGRNSNNRVSIDDVIINTFDVICRYVQLEGARGWREISCFLRSQDGPATESEPSSLKSDDAAPTSKSTYTAFHIMLILALRSMENCPSSVLSYLTNQINPAELDRMLDICAIAMKFKKFSSKYLTSWMTVAKNCIWSPLNEIRCFGGFIYRQLFTTVEKHRQIVIDSMLSHLSVSDNEAEVILSTLDILVEKNLESLLPSVSDLHKSLDLIDLLSYDNIKRLFKILITIYTKEPGQKKLKRDVQESIGKMLCSVNEKEQIWGILGMLVQLDHSLIENEADRENKIRNKLEQLRKATDQSCTVRSLFYQQMSIVIKNNLKSIRSETLLAYTNDLFTKFRSEFFIERPSDYVAFNDLECDKFVNKKSNIWISGSSEKFAEAVPLFELLKQAALLKRYWNTDEDTQSAVNNHFSSFFFAFEANVDLSDFPTDTTCDKHLLSSGLDKLYHVIQWIRTLMNTFCDQKNIADVSPELLEELWKQKFFLLMCCQRELVSKLEVMKTWSTPSLPGEPIYTVLADARGKKRGIKRKDTGAKSARPNETLNETKVENDESVFDDDETATFSTDGNNIVAITSLHKHFRCLKLSAMVRLLQYVHQKRKATTFILSELHDIFLQILPKRDASTGHWAAKVSGTPDTSSFHGDNTHIWDQVLEVIPVLWRVLETSSLFFRADMNTSDVYDMNTEVSGDMILLLKTDLDVLLSIFSWKDISLRKAESSRIQRSRAKKRSIVMQKIEHTIINLNSQKEEGEDAERSVLSSLVSIAQSAPSIQVAIVILEIIVSLNSWTPELKKKAAQYALGFLKREWSDSDGKPLKGGILNNAVKSILGHYINLRPESARLSCIQWLIANKVAELLPDGERRKSKMAAYEKSGDPELSELDKNSIFHCFNKTTIFGIYKVLFSCLNTSVSSYLMASRSDEIRCGTVKTAKVVADWQNAANSFSLLGLILRVKSVRNAVVLTSAVKEGRQFLNLLFHKNSSFIFITQDRTRARSVATELSAVIKSVQIGNRTLQNIGVYAKTVKSAALLKGLPELRAANELFMRTVQKVFVGIECHQAFEIGLLKSRNIDGEEIVNEEEKESEGSGSTEANEEDVTTNNSSDDEHTTRETSPVY